MAYLECRDCAAHTTTSPGVIPEGWSPQWLEAPEHGPYTYSVIWCCPDCTDDLYDFRPPKMHCSSCFEGYSKHPARAAWCPSCKALAGEPCKRPSGHEYWQGGVHAEREQLALDEGKMRYCPNGHTARRHEPHIDDPEVAAQAGLTAPQTTLF